MCALAAGVTACEDELADPTIPLLEKHMNVPDPGPDTSNKYAALPAAAALGKKFYFDTDFSGPEVYADMLLRTMTTPGRATTGQPIKVSCNSCHDVTKGGADHTSDPPGNTVSFGGGAYDVNSQQTVNSAFNKIIYWNGRNDSLWAQIVAVTESHVSMNGSRLRVAWRIADTYRAEYTALFPDDPIPAAFDSITAQKARLEADGTCTLVAGACPTDFCQNLNTVCLPRFPLEGRPGFVRSGELGTCDPTHSDPLLAPNDDAYDCMKLEDQQAVTRMYVNWAKAIAAYEYTLISRDSPFDKWAASGFKVGGLGASAERGARLFVGKAACAECHAGPLFQDNLFHTIGMPQTGTYIPQTSMCPAGDAWCDCVTDDTNQPLNCLAWGWRDGLRKLQANKFRRDGVWSDDTECQRHFSVHTDANYAAAHPDECDGRVGYYSLARTDDQKGQWRTPGLRDVAVTGPYMHTGQYKTLREVIEHYNKGGMVDAQGGEILGTIDSKIKPLNLTSVEMDDLVAFLQTLTGTLDSAVSETPSVPPDSAF